jgi:hypothetical protein
MGIVVLTSVNLVHVDSHSGLVHSSRYLVSFDPKNRLLVLQLLRFWQAGGGRSLTDSLVCEPIILIDIGVVQRATRRIVAESRGGEREPGREHQKPSVHL